MNFEEAYKKVADGTATDEEAAFVGREIVNAQRITALLSDDAPPRPVLETADEDTVRKARRAFNLRTTLRVIVIVLVSLGVIAGATLGIIFGTAGSAAKKSAVYSREEAVDLAGAYIADYTGKDAAAFVVHDVDKKLDMGDGLSRSVRIYEVELRDGEKEYEVEVNAKSGYTMLTDLDYHGF
mgnify:FL=1